MKKIPSCFPSVLLLLCGLAAATAPAVAALAPTPYEQAVMEYEKSATRQLDAYQAKIAAGLKDDNVKNRYAVAKVTLDQCYALLAKLKEADEPHFDPAKAAFEKAQQRLIALVGQAETP